MYRPLTMSAAGASERPLTMSAVGASESRRGEWVKRGVKAVVVSQSERRIHGDNSLNARSSYLGNKYVDICKYRKLS